MNDTTPVRVPTKRNKLKFWLVMAQARAVVPKPRVVPHEPGPFFFLKTRLTGFVASISSRFICESRSCTLKTAKLRGKGAWSLMLRATYLFAKSMISL